MSFHGVKEPKRDFFWLQTFFKIWHVEKFLIQNLTRCILSIQNLTRCINFKSQSEALWKFYFKIWQVSKLFLRNLISILFFRLWLSDDIFCQRYYQIFSKRDLKDNALYRVSRQMENWKLPHVNSSLNVWGIVLWQYTFSQKLRTEHCGA